MKYALASAVLVGITFGFPSSLKANQPWVGKQMPAGMAKILAGRHSKRQEEGIHVPFDAASQHISTSGHNAWIAPGPLDLRGPCPGLNALANHGYLPHNGVATIDQLIAATTSVFGMGEDLATFLAVYGAVFDGDLSSLSIGGLQPTGRFNPGAPFGQPEGLSNSHNKYETDVSPTRGDLFEYGNDYAIVESQWDALYALQADKTEDTSNYDLSQLNPFRARRFNQSLNENPYFFNAPFSGVIVQPKSYTFIYRFMSNRSEECPEGRLSQEVLKSFFGVTGQPGNWSIPLGHERIPDNWYTRNSADQYSIPFFALDVMSAAETYPEFIDIGGNLGKTNSFVGVDINNLTSGVYNSETLGESDHAFCFVFELLLQALPNLIENLFRDTQAALVKIQGPIMKIAAQLNGCPQLNDIQVNQINATFSKYPGFTQLKADGTYVSSYGD